jgi:hypothetical protein
MKLSEGDGKMDKDVLLKWLENEKSEAETKLDGFGNLDNLSPLQIGSYMLTAGHLSAYNKMMKHLETETDHEAE